MVRPSPDLKLGTAAFVCPPRANRYLSAARCGLIAIFFVSIQQMGNASELLRCMLESLNLLA
jgi:hypothetical protein